jgi:hypothetical protein
MKNYKRLFDKEFTIPEISGYLLVIIYVICTIYFIYIQNTQICILQDSLKSMMNNYTVIDRQLNVIIDSLANKENEIEVLKERLIELIGEKSDHNEVMDYPMKESDEMKKFYIKTILGIAGVGVLGCVGLSYYKGFSVFKICLSMMPKSVVSFVSANAWFNGFNKIKTYTVIDDSDLQLKWVVDVVNDTMCYIFVEPLSGEPKILASVYFSERVNSELVDQIALHSPSIINVADTFSKVVM